MAIVQALLLVYILIFFLRGVLSWIPNANDGALGQLNHFTIRVTEPLLRPVRRVVPTARVGNVGLDVSFLIVTLALLLILKLI